MSDEQRAPSAARTVTVAVLTVSASRTLETDAVGELLASRSAALGHHVLKRLVLPPSREAVEAQLRAWVAEETLDVVLVTGGVGLRRADVTPEAVRAVLDREIPGFGEHVRRVRSEREGTGALRTREVAGIAGATLVFAMPSDAGACREAWDSFLAEQLDPRAPGPTLVALLPELGE